MEGKKSLAKQRECGPQAAKETLIAKHRVMPDMEKSKVSKANKERLWKRFLLLLPLGIATLGAMLFLPAGTFDYWQAWLFLGVIFIPFLFVATYFLKRDPAFLERRMKYKEKEAKQGTIVKLSGLFFFIGILVPGFDYRYGWSDVPVMLVLISDLIIFLGYMLVFRVFKENSYASRTIEVVKGQKVITTGPYAVIRHPMYAGVIAMYFFIPLALGSFWALAFFIPSLALIPLRAINEEKTLAKELKGYKAYMEKVRYRLIPHVW